jgi:hypothetical protein
MLCVVFVEERPSIDPSQPASRGPDTEGQSIAEVMGVARCPCCRAPLAVRVGRWGPYFQCLCAEGAWEVRRPY